MSGRGRGRGRGGGSGPRSISQQYLQNSAQAAGIDVKHVNNMIGGGSNHKIFGDLELHSSGERRLHSHESDLLNDGTVGGGKSSMSTVDGGEVAVKSEPPGTSSSSLIRDDNAEAVNSKPNSPKTVYLISKSREMHHKFQNSIFYIRGSSNTKDVVRYSDRKRHPTPSSESTNDAVGDILSHCLGGKKRTLGDGGGIFIPEELCGGQKQQKRRIVASSDGGGGEESDKKKTNLAELAAKEGGDGDNNGDEQKQPSSNTATGGIIDEDEGEEVIQHQHEDDEDESDGADYVHNYYESEDDNASAGDGDGEPTF